MQASILQGPVTAPDGVHLRTLQLGAWAEAQHVEAEAGNAFTLRYIVTWTKTLDTV